MSCSPSILYLRDLIAAHVRAELARAAQARTSSLALLVRLWRAGRLDAQAFRWLLAALPRALDPINAALQRQADAPDPAPAQAAFWATIRQLVDAALWELLSDFRPETLPVLDRIQFLRGGQYLLRLGEELVRQNITSLPNHHPTDARVHTLRHLLHALARRDDERAQLIPLLRELGEPTLLAMLPHARAQRWCSRTTPRLIAGTARAWAGGPRARTSPAGARACGSCRTQRRGAPQISALQAAVASCAPACPPSRYGARRVKLRVDEHVRGAMVRGLLR